MLRAEQIVVPRSKQTGWLSNTKKLSPENIHISNSRKTELDIVRKSYVFPYTSMHLMTNNERRGYTFWAEQIHLWECLGVWGAGVAVVPRWRPGLQPSLMTCTWLPHTPENKPRPLGELRRCTMMQDQTIWQVMILANGLLLRGLGWWGVVEGLYKGLRLGADR